MPAPTTTLEPLAQYLLLFPLSQQLPLLLTALLLVLPHHQPHLLLLPALLQHQHPQLPQPLEA
jgi:hypothetical protein